jgi:hypothetical protein
LLLKLLNLELGEHSIEFDPRSLKLRVRGLHNKPSWINKFYRWSIIAHFFNCHGGESIDELQISERCQSNISIGHSSNSNSSEAMPNSHQSDGMRECALLSSKESCHRFSRFVFSSFDDSFMNIYDIFLSASHADEPAFVNNRRFEK